MAIVTYINNDYELLAQGLQPLVARGYFAAIDYDADAKAIHCKDNAGETILKMTYGQNGMTVEFRFSDGVTRSNTLGGSSSNRGIPLYLYLCSGGAYILCGAKTFVVISRTNNGDTGVVYVNNASKRQDPYGWSVGDLSDRSTEYYSFINDTKIRNQTTMFPVPVCSNMPGVAAYFPDVKSIVASQFPAYNGYQNTPPENFTQDGKRYLWIGNYAISDEEETS